MNTPKPAMPSLFRASSLTAVAIFLSRIVGYLRDSMFSMVFSKELTDIFWASFRIPNTFRQLFGEGAVSVAFIPIMTQVTKDQGNRDASRLLSACLGLVFIVTVLISALGIWYAGFLSHTLLEFPEEVTSSPLMDLAEDMVQIMFPYLVLVCLAAVLSGALNAIGSFFIPGMTAVYFNLSLLAGTWLAWRNPDYDFRWQAWFVLVGGFLQVLAQLPSLWGIGFDLKSFFAWWTVPEIRRVFALFLPASLTLGMRQINTLVNTNLASTLGTGPISYLFYADRLAELPLAVFGFAIATAAFPHFSSSAMDISPEAIKKPLLTSLRGYLLILLPSTFILWVLGEPLLGTLFNRGKFALEGGLEQTLPALRMFSLGLIPFACVKLFGNLSYSLGDGRSPVFAGLTSAVTNLIFAYTLRLTPLKHSGLALAVVLAATANLLVLVYRLRFRLDPRWFLELVPLLLKILISTVLTCGITHLCLQYLEHWKHYQQAILGCTLASLAYLAFGFLFFRQDIQPILNRFRRFTGS